MATLPLMAKILGSYKYYVLICNEWKYCIYVSPVFLV